ncbi:aspartate/glutamate racemase family protein [Bradyrhizobium sp. dw_78]|uniref:aspartate/glutamate racemase family protein n=1 Tax=Bradyrhizobium sp. dw_78 TaxID=2719793 RepID=UPI001BD2269D|nr:aspartate/glutamate racemase family protein [Bradyrhizobium sp. dw_78]
MRILLINPNTSVSITETIAARARAAAGDGVEFLAVTGGFGASYIASRAAVVVAAHAALDALTQHVDECDAVYLACFGDPGLLALREQSPVPVVAMAEASMQEACRIADRFSIVTGGAAWEPILSEYVTSLGLTGRLASIRTLAATGDQIAREPDAALAELTASCMACASADGADAVILGGAGLAGFAPQIQPRIPVPVICSMDAGTRAAVQAARGGDSNSRDART